MPEKCSTCGKPIDDGRYFYRGPVGVYCSYPCFDCRPAGLPAARAKSPIDLANERIEQQGAQINDLREQLEQQGAQIDGLRERLEGLEVGRSK